MIISIIGMIISILIKKFKISTKLQIYSNKCEINTSMSNIQYFLQKILKSGFYSKCTLLSVPNSAIS